MEKELDPVLLKATQTSLGKYVKRPPLTEKLLKKPPFRFLHDIVTYVLKTTGFFQGLFDEEELVSENVKDRDSKIVFLNKVITVVGWTTGKSLSVKASKIVAGQEPDKTNELLQCIAQALDKKLSSDDAVKRFRDGSKTSKSTEKKNKDSSRSVKKPTETTKLTSKSTEKLTSQKKESTTRIKNDVEAKTKQKEINVQKKISQQPKPNVSKKESLEKQKSESSVSNVVKYEAKENNSEVKNEVDQNVNAAKSDCQKVTVDINADLKENNHEHYDEQNLNSSYTIVDNGLNSSLSSQDLMETENVNQESLHQDVNNDHISSLTIQQNSINEEIVPNKKHQNYEGDKKESHEDSNNIDNTSNGITDIKKEEKLDIQSSVTKSPSKVKNIRPLSVRPSSSRPGAPRPRDKHENILVEAENIMVGKVNIIAESTPNEEEEETSMIVVEEDSHARDAKQDEQEKMQASLNEHGHLVQQILDSQKEYSQKTGKTEIEWQFGAKKARDALNKEIEQVRFDIQALSRVANPLGKLLDHIQEDVEVMRQELHQWTKTFEEASKELSIQKAANEESLFPLYAKVKQLDSDITEKHDKISDLKIIIHKNSQRIEKLLENGNVQ